MRWQAVNKDMAHKWFAWYPVKASVSAEEPYAKTWVWLDTIYRCRILTLTNDTYYLYKLNKY